jgi:cell division protein FtsL
MINASNNGTLFETLPNCEYIEFYIHRILNFIGIISNSICVFIFATILKNERQQSNMFRFFFVKSINDLIFSILLIFDWIGQCLNCSLKYKYAIVILQTVSYWYIAEITSVCSGCLEIASTFDCYNLLSDKYQFMKTKKAFYIVTIAIYLIFTVYISFFFIRWDIALNDVGYVLQEKTELIYSFYLYVIVIIRDFLILILLVFLNSLILIQMKHLTESRKNINNNNQNLLVAQALHAEHNKVKMIISVGLNYFILHFPNDLDKVFKLPTKLSTISGCYREFFITFFDLCYYDSIVFYIIFNITFKKTFIKYFTLKKLRLYLIRNRINTINTINS